MRSFFLKPSLEYYYFPFVFILGIVLFSFNLNNSPLTPDELSAISRSNHDSLSALFKLSILNDVHPPIAQIFLYFWIKIFGNSPILIKVPFLLMGIGCIPLFFKIATNWFNKNVALLSTAFFISIQFIIMYSQVARPYISGLFLCLFMVLYWTKIIENKARTVDYIFYLLFGVICSQNHYFGTLQVCIIGLTGLLFLNKKQLVKYLSVNFLICLFFLPCLSIMMKQMNYDGINYLKTPDLNYLLNYFFYVFQYSWIAVLLVTSILIYGVLKIKTATNKYTLISFLWFCTPILIGYAYSVLARPVMPFRSLIFSVPFFIIFLFSFSLRLKKQVVFALTLALLVVNISTLILKRNHYQLFEKGISKTAVYDTMNLIAKSENTFVLFNAPNFNVEYYKTQFKTNFEYLNIRKNTQSPIGYRETIKSINQDNLIAFNLPLNLISIIKEYFPYQNRHDFGFNYNLYLFSKNPTKELPSLIDTTLTFENEFEKQSSNNLTFDSVSGNHYHNIKENVEWGPSISIPLGKIAPNKYCIIESSVNVISNNNNGTLVFQISDGEELIAWRSSTTQDWLSNFRNWQTVNYSVQLNELIQTEQLTDSLTLKVYYWNTEKKLVSIDDISIKISLGNHLIYSLLEDFPSSGKLLNSN